MREQKPLSDLDMVKLLISYYILHVLYIVPGINLFILTCDGKISCCRSLAIILVVLNVYIIIYSRCFANEVCKQS